MVLPELDKNKRHTREEIIKAYMGCDWHKEIEFDWVYISNTQPRVKRLRFTADTLPCGKQNDTQFQLTFVQTSPMGAIWHCAVCGKTDGPITEEVGRTITDRAITWDEAWDIINRTGQYPPIGMERAIGSRIKIA